MIYSLSSFVREKVFQRIDEPSLSVSRNPFLFALPTRPIGFEAGILSN